MYIKKFYEAVIMPDRMKHGKIYSYLTLLDYSRENDFLVLLYQDFYDSLQEEDKEEAPPPIDYFGVFNTEKNTSII